MLSYDDWFDKYSDSVIADMEQWFDSCPYPISSSGLDVLIDLALEIAYESFVGEYEDYMYEQYKERSLWDKE